MENKKNQKNNSKGKSAVDKNIIYIIVIVLALAGFFGVNKILSNNNKSLGKILFRSAISNNNSSEEIVKEGLDYYIEKYGQETDPSLLEAKRVDLGCHFEIHIFEEGELVMRLGYAGKIYEL